MELDLVEPDLDEVILKLASTNIDENLAVKALKEIAVGWGDQLTLEDLIDKWETAQKAVGDSLRGVTGHVKEYLETVTESYFSVTDVFLFVSDRNKRYKSLQTLQTLRNNVRVVLFRLKKDGQIRAIPSRPGTYEVVNDELERQDWQAADTNPEKIILPFALSNMVELYEGNVILVSGVRNVGKTCVLLNMVKDNMHGYDVSYYNSEGGPTELKKRLSLFEDVPINGWEFEPYARNKDFGHAIELAGNGPRTMHIIDYLELYEDFWSVGGLVNEIWAALDGGIAVIGIQKPTGRDIPIGGELSLDKPRLALALDRGKVTIIKAKAWKGMTNPNYLSAHFHILNGSAIKPLGGAYEWTLKESK